MKCKIYDIIMMKHFHKMESNRLRKCRTKKFAGRNKRRQKSLFLNIEYLYSNITIILAGYHRTKTKEDERLFPRLKIYHSPEKDNWLICILENLCVKLRR